MTASSRSDSDSDPSGVANRSMAVLIDSASFSLTLTHDRWKNMLLTLNLVS